MYASIGSAKSEQRRTPRGKRQIKNIDLKEDCANNPQVVKSFSLDARYVNIQSGGIQAVVAGVESIVNDLSSCSLVKVEHEVHKSRYKILITIAASAQCESYLVDAIEEYRADLKDLYEENTKGKKEDNKSVDRMAPQACLA